MEGSSNASRDSAATYSFIETILRRYAFIDSTDAVISTVFGTFIRTYFVTNKLVHQYYELYLY